jgi:hypothetical protein
MKEENLHKAICDYIKLQYPKVIFNTDLSGIRLTQGQAREVKNLRSGNGFPDIVIYEPKGEIVHNNIVTYLYCGLFLEVKKESPYKKDGKLKSNKHLENQDKMHQELRKRGYMAQFVWDFDNTKFIIDNYLNIKFNE